MHDTLDDLLGRRVLASRKPLDNSRLVWLARPCGGLSTNHLAPTLREACRWWVYVGSGPGSIGGCC